jgi:6-phosphogluconolactonase
MKLGQALVSCVGLVFLQAHAYDKVHARASMTRSSELFYIGTHGVPGLPPAAAPQRNEPSESDSSSQGIYAARLDERTGHLSSLGISIKLQRATWLITNPTLPVIYSVADSGDGIGTNSSIYSLKVDTTSGQLHVINKEDAGGRDSTAMVLDAPSNTILSANYGSGDISVLPLKPDGSLGSVISALKDYGTGPSSRQKTPHAHGVVVDPTRKYVLVADLGADRIFIHHFDASTRALTPAQPPFEPLPAGSGPRHLLFHPNGRFLFVDTELTGELRSYRWDAEKAHLQLLQTLSPYPTNYSGEKSAAEITVTRDGRFAYLSLRGDMNVIVVYSVNKRSGNLKEIQRLSAQGQSPWSFGIDPSGHWMLVTNEASDSVAALRLDPVTGKLSATGESLAIPKPVTVTFCPN